MKPIFLCALLVGCTASADDYPIQPGGGTSPTGGSNGSGSMISGRVCMVENPWFLDSCSTSDASGITVTLGGATATTAGDGTFAIAGSATEPGGFRVTGDAIMPVTMPVSAAPIIPIFRADLFDQMMADNGIVPTSGSGSIIGTVVRAGVPAVNIGISSTPSPAFGPFFDGSQPPAWGLNATGSRGVFWAPGIAAGPATITLQDLADSGETTIDGIQVVNGGITIVDTVLP